MTRSPRFKNQCAEILAMLQAGPASNVMLAGLALKYTSRISDLRKAGYAIENYDLNKVTGLSWYRLTLPVAA